MSEPKWAVGKRKIGPGVYVDERDKSMHFDTSELCRHMGVPITRENVEIAERAALDAFRAAYPEVKPIVEIVKTKEDGTPK